VSPNKCASCTHRGANRELGGESGALASPGELCRQLLEQLGFTTLLDADKAAVRVGDGPAHVTISILPCRGGQIADGVWDTISVFLVGAHAAVAALGWLRWARMHREPVKVEVSAAAVGLQCLGERLPRAVCQRWPKFRALGRSAIVAPCLDGWISSPPLTSQQRDDFRHLSGLDDAPLPASFRKWAAGRSRQELVSEAQLWQLPILPVLSRAEAVAPQSSEPSTPFRFTWTPSEPPESRRCRLSRDTLPLDDLRIFDLGAVWSGPYCGRLLGQLGAHVIKVESPHRLDGTRPPSPDECSGVFSDLNAGKSSVLLNLSDPSDSARFKRMLTRVDGLIENFSPRVMPNLGLDSAALQSVNPELIAVSMPAFPSAGARSKWVGYGSDLELAAGLSQADPGHEPRPAPVPFTDYLAGCYAAAAFLAALHRRDECREGAHVQVAQHTVACQLLKAPWRPRTATQWEPGIWIRDAPPGLVESEPIPLTPHLRAPCWSAPGKPRPARATAVEAGADTRTVLRELLYSSTR
jgi:hypothetical protein